MCVAEAVSVILRYPLGGKALIELGLLIVAGETIGKVIVGYTDMFVPDAVVRAPDITVWHPDKILNAALALIVPVAVVAVEMLKAKDVVPIAVTVTAVFNAVFGEGTPEIVTRDPTTIPCPEGTVAVLVALATPAAIELIVTGPEAFPV